MNSQTHGFRWEKYNIYLHQRGFLLPQRPEEVGAQNRRPADIFLPSLHGTPAALDLAITAPQRQDIVAQAAGAALAAASAYAATKASHLNTAPLCGQQGVRFVPIVAESTGAWDREAGQILLQIACSAAARTGDAASTLHSELLQELSVIIRSHRARAVLRRRAELAGWAYVEYPRPMPWSLQRIPASPS